MSIKKISDESGVKVLRWSFSEAQNGKSSSDQKASIVKARVRSYVKNNKAKVETEEDFFKALNIPHPLEYMTIALNTVKAPEKIVKPKALTGISKYSEFVFEDDGIRVYKYMGIGPGKLFLYKTHKPFEHVPHLTPISEHNILKNDDQSAIPTKDSEKAKLQLQQDPLYWRITRAARQIQAANIYHCTENGCIAKFATVTDLEVHQLLNVHTYLPEKLTSMDFAMKYYAENLNSADCEECVETVIRDQILENALIPNMDRLKQGWALKTARTFPKITVAARAFLLKIFIDGETSNKKTSPEQAARKMSAARNAEGTAPLFRPEEVLKVGQIKSHFAYLHKERKCELPPPSPAKKPKVAKCVYPDPETANYSETDEEEEETDNSAEVPDINEQTLRRSQRIINMNNDFLFREHEKDIENMIENATE